MTNNVVNLVKLRGAQPTLFRRNRSKEQWKESGRVSDKAAKYDNRLFGRYRLRMSRDILGLSIDEIAERYNVSAHSWRKYEEGSRELPGELREILQKDIKFQVKCIVD